MPRQRYVATIQEAKRQLGHKKLLIQSIQGAAGLFLPLTILKRKPRPLTLLNQHRRHIHDTLIIPAFMISTYHRNGRFG
jgi:hypothetical protein